LITFNNNKIFLNLKLFIANKAEVCIRDGQQCDHYVDSSQNRCCDGLKCVVDGPHTIVPSIETFLCLNCENKTNGLCGGPNDIKCCPIFGCVRNDTNQKSYGKCIEKAVAGR
jgi:hypothetical protein